MLCTGPESTAQQKYFSVFPLSQAAQGGAAGGDIKDSSYPTTLAAWADGILSLGDSATHFGFVFEGSATLSGSSGAFTLSAGMYFSVYGRSSVGGPGKGLVVSRWDYRGFFHLGGPIEEKGRLQYIDGCTDSLLIPPVIKGDPCLNLLHIPPGTRQTPHTHPSLRVGLIVDGHGHCVTPAATTPLAPGQVFIIQAGDRHSFHTQASALTLIAYHPDSDFGPTHTDHPMINRTQRIGNG